MTKLPFQNRRSSECIFLHWFTVALRCMRKKGQGGLLKVPQLSRGPGSLKNKHSGNFEETDHSHSIYNAHTRPVHGPILVTFTWILHYAQNYTSTLFYAHTTRQIRPFPAGPCRCSRNSRVGLSGKQTVRGCWESSLGLQIIAWLTRVSEPARLLLHTCTHKVHTHAHEHMCTWPMHTKGIIEAHFKAHIQSGSNGSLSVLQLS